MKNKIQQTVPTARQNCPSILSMENDNTKLLTYEEEIKEYVVKIIGK